MISTLAGNVAGRGSRITAARYTIYQTRLPEQDDALNRRDPSQGTHLAMRLSIIGCRPCVPVPAAQRKRLARRAHGGIVESIAAACCLPGRPGSRMGSENRMSEDIPCVVINGARELSSHSRAEKTRTCRSLAADPCRGCRRSGISKRFNIQIFDTLTTDTAKLLQSNTGPLHRIFGVLACR